MDEEEDIEVKTLIDLGTKKTQTGWMIAIDQFILAATPKIFEWFGWIITLGILKYVAEESNYMPLKVIVNISYFIIIFYYQAYFCKFHIRIPGIKDIQIERKVSILISCTIAFFTYLIVTNSVDMFVEIRS